MEQDKRQEFVQLLKNSTLFPHYAKQMLAVAFFNQVMSDRETTKLYSVLKQEKREIDKVNEKYQDTVTKLKQKYRIKDLPVDNQDNN